MPASLLSLRLTDAYRDRLLVLRQRALAYTQAQFGGVDFDDLDRSYRRLADAIAAGVIAVQAEGVRLTGGYLAAFVATETAEQPAPVDLDADRYVGVADDGRPVARALLPALFTIKLAVAQGNGQQVARRAGLHRAARTVAVATMHAPRAALTDGIAEHDAIVGWRRVTTGNPCGACLGASTGAVHDTGSTMPVHAHCRCTKEPVVRDVADRARRPTGRELFDGMTPDQQAALFAGRGGEAKAALVRDGAVPLDALVSRSPMATTEDVITETPLAALTRS